MSSYENFDAHEKDYYAIVPVRTTLNKKGLTGSKYTTSKNKIKTF